MKIERLDIRQYDAVQSGLKGLIQDTMLCNFPDAVIDDAYYPDTLCKIRHYLEDGSAVIYAAMDEDRLCGWIWCHEICRFDEKRLHIAHLAVEKQCRKQGIGRLLIQRVEAYALENGYSGLELFVTRSNKSAVRFYEKQGYEVDRLFLRKGL